MGVKVHRSDECSDIIFESTGDGVFTSCKDGSYNKGVREDGNSGKSNSNTSKMILLKINKIHPIQKK